MLHVAQELEKFRIGASDGTIGHVRDFYFDDQQWVIRYVVVSTGAWLAGREVLISPYSIGTLNYMDRLMPVSISREQVKQSPSIDTDEPVSRQHEAGYLGYYGYPAYWGGTGLWGPRAYPRALLNGLAFNGSDMAYAKAEAADERAACARAAQRRALEDPHLRSCNAVKGYHLVATEGEIGHVGGFLVDERTWAIQYLVVNTSNWWLGHEVLIAPEWITDVIWSRSKVVIDLTQQQIQNAPAYEPDTLMNRGHEERLYQHYERQGYWQGKSAQR